MCVVCEGTGKRGLLGAQGGGQFTTNCEKCGGTGLKPEAPKVIESHELVSFVGSRPRPTDRDDEDEPLDMWTPSSAGSGGTVAHTAPAMKGKPSAPVADRKPKDGTTRRASGDALVSAKSEPPRRGQQLGDDNFETCDACCGVGRKGLLGPVGSGRFTTPCDKCGGTGRMDAPRFRRGSAM